MFTHLNEQSVTMVDVSEKNITLRTAEAKSEVQISESLYVKLKESSYNKKGSIFDTSIVAGIIASKKTSEIIPMCHQIPLSKVEIKFDLMPNQVVFHSFVKTEAKTGVEMEALTAASVAALTFYDMVKSEGYDLVIANIRLVKKTGGKSDYSLMR